MSTDIIEIKDETTKQLAMADAIEISSNEENSKAAEFVKALKTLKGKLNDVFDPQIKNAHTAWKGLIAEKKKHTDPIDKADSTVRLKIGQFFQKKEDERKKEQDRLDKEAKDKEDREKAKLEKRADKAEEKGKDEKADELREEAETTHVPAGTAVNQAEKQGGIAMVKTRDFEIVDEMALPRSYLKPDESAIRQMIKAKKGVIQIPGVKITEKMSPRGTWVKR